MAQGKTLFVLLGYLILKKASASASPTAPAAAHTHEDDDGDRRRRGKSLRKERIGKIVEMHYKSSLEPRDELKTRVTCNRKTLSAFLLSLSLFLSFSLSLLCIYFYLQAAFAKFHPSY